MQLRFQTAVETLEEERVIATLWGCIERRLTVSPLALRANATGDLALNSHSCDAKIMMEIAETNKQEKADGNQNFGDSKPRTGIL